eukprot:CAMPEP_0115160198 /NCGR_PEP_ID=MMETSP0227-20121206/70659_1 /TAXON_ID=89957 /ORGANISM="Polarella glacialis, Strain CCMP 1383" /LENGTH=269 /DNA_ID=CAMNT_0002572043 /DNA_START=69 /DNA_END=875 /DNA_ORIENTATION=-
MRVVPSEGAGELDLRGHTLVLPGCGGVAHLSELCVDALVTTYGLSRVAFVQTRHVLPVAMISAWSTPGSAADPLAITTAVELYQGANAPGLTVLQIRSAALDGHRQALAREILSWTREAGVAKILMLASCSAHVKRDADLDSSSELRSIWVGGGIASEASTGKLDVNPLGHSVPEEELGGAAGSAAAARLMLRGSGLARVLLLQAAEDLEVPTEASGAAFAPPPRGAESLSIQCPQLGPGGRDGTRPAHILEASPDQDEVLSAPMVMCR